MKIAFPIGSQPSNLFAGRCQASSKFRETNFIHREMIEIFDLLICKVCRLGDFEMFHFHLKL